VNLHAYFLREIHSKHLQDTMQDLPSEVYDKGTTEQFFKWIKKKNRELDQFLGKASKQNPEEKDILKSRLETSIKIG